MQKYYGNYLGLVINDQDPDTRGRVQVWVPHVLPALERFKNSNTSITGIGENIENGLTNDDIGILTKILPWAEGAMPITGKCTSYNVTGGIATPTGGGGAPSSSQTKEAKDSYLQSGNTTSYIHPSIQTNFDNLVNIANEYFKTDEDKIQVEIADKTELDRVLRNTNQASSNATEASKKGAAVILSIYYTDDTTKYVSDDNVYKTKLTKFKSDKLDVIQKLGLEAESLNDIPVLFIYKDWKNLKVVDNSPPSPLGSSSTGMILNGTDPATGDEGDEGPNGIAGQTAKGPNQALIKLRRDIRGLTERAYAQIALITSREVGENAPDTNQILFLETLINRACFGYEGNIQQAIDANYWGWSVVNENTSVASEMIKKVDVNDPSTYKNENLTKIKKNVKAVLDGSNLTDLACENAADIKNYALASHRFATFKASGSYYETRGRNLIRVEADQTEKTLKEYNEKSKSSKQLPRGITLNKKYNCFYRLGTKAIYSTNAERFYYAHPEIRTNPSVIINGKINSESQAYGGGTDTYNPSPSVAPTILPSNQTLNPAIIPNTSNAPDGSLNVPGVGASVWVFFREGDPLFPVYFAASYSKNEWAAATRSSSPTPVQGSATIGGLNIIRTRDKTPANPASETNAVSLAPIDGNASMTFSSGKFDIAAKKFNIASIQDSQHNFGGALNTNIESHANFTCKGNKVTIIGDWSPATLSVLEELQKIHSEIQNVLCVGPDCPTEESQKPAKEKPVIPGKPGSPLTTGPNKIGHYDIFGKNFNKFVSKLDYTTNSSLMSLDSKYANTFADFIEALQEWVTANYGSFTVKAIKGWKHPGEQLTDYKRGRNNNKIVNSSKIITNNKPWTSPHQYGLAIDLGVYDSKGALIDEDKSFANYTQQIYLYASKLCSKYGLVSGLTSLDRNHFEVSGWNSEKVLGQQNYKTYIEQSRRTIF